MNGRLFPVVNDDHAEWVKPTDLTAVIDVPVRPRDIKDGVPLDPGRCAIALALGHMKGVDHAIVLRHTIYVVMKDGTVLRGRPDGGARNLLSLNDVTGEAFPTRVRVLPFAPADRIAARREAGRAQRQRERDGLVKHRGDKATSTPVLSKVTRNATTPFRTLSPTTQAVYAQWLAGRGPRG